MSSWLLGCPRLSWRPRDISRFIRGFCIANIFLFALYIFQSFYAAATYDVPKISILTSETEIVENETTLEEYLFVLSRNNIFGDSASRLQKYNTLPLRLVGNICLNHLIEKKVKCVSIIEDLRSDEQDVFDESETVFKVGQLDVIGYDYVDIVSGLVRYRIYLDSERTEQQKKIQDIEKEVPEAKKKSEDIGITETSFRNYNIKKNLVKEVMGNLNHHLQGGYSKTHEDGILIYGLTRDSIFRKIGLANSDIITHINGKALTSFSGAKELYDAFISGGITSIGSVEIIIKRAGLDIPLNYTMVD